MMRRVLLVLALTALSGCGLLYDPCGDLDERICTDLGSDCATFRAEEDIYGAIIPVRRRQSERAQCEMFAADVNYSTYTLPFVRYLIQAHRTPGVRMPNLPRPQPADGLASGVSSYCFYFIPFLVIPGIFFYSWRMMQRAMAAYSAPQAPFVAAPVAPFAAAPPPAGPWDHVDSREKAEEQVRFGALVRVELIPTYLGGLAVPENVVYLPPDAAARKSALDQQVAQMVQGGSGLRYVAEPQYRGRSFVPASLMLKLGEQTQVVQVW